ncbi:MAG: ABC transporter ATP-binding protein [Deltaproteobacteria bacterium]|nr:ABC transporter ATP-binding protein [Deltaproteobacteria bacterium]
MAPPAVKAEGISYAYRDTEAVKDISFEVAPGEILGLLGPNGAGKSTTIKVLTGQLTPRTGRAFILGKEVKQDNPEVQAVIGVCFEEKNLYLNMTAVENLSFFAGLFGIKHFDTKGLLRMVGLGERAGDRVKNYSKGMQQRLMVARSLINSPRVLFLDEPTNGLDPVSSQAIRAIIKAEAGKGAAVLLTTHDMHEADELSDRVVFLNEGRIHAMDTPENLKLKHGKRSVRVRLMHNGVVKERIVPLDEASTGEQLKSAVDTEGILTIHTEEATLEDIFVQMTGRGLRE